MYVCLARQKNFRQSIGQLYLVALIGECALPGKTDTQIFCVGRETDLKSINFYIALARVVNKILIDVQKKLQLHLI